MKTLILTTLIFLTGIIVQAQCDKANYDKLIREGDQLAKNEKYINAVRKYMAATVICPDNNEKTQQKIVDLFNKIEALKIKAEQNEKLAIEALEETEKHKLKAQQTLDELNKASKNFIISVDRMNVLYKGIEIPISWVVPGKVLTRISFDKPGHLYSDSAGRYIIRIDETGIVNFTVYISENGNKVELGRRSFRVKPLPSPVPVLDGGKFNSYILLSDLIKTKGIIPLLENFDFNVQYNVLGYQISGYTGKGPFVINIKQNNMGKYTRGILKKVLPDSKIVFSDIKVIGPDSIVKNIGSLSLTVVRSIPYQNVEVFKSQVNEYIERQDWTNLQEFATTNLGKYHSKNALLLNEIAYDFYLYMDNKDALLKALDWITRANQLKENEPVFLTTQASILFKLGRKDEALLIKKSVSNIEKEKEISTFEIENLILDSDTIRYYALSKNYSQAKKMRKYIMQQDEFIDIADYANLAYWCVFACDFEGAVWAGNEYIEKGGNNLKTISMLAIGYLWDGDFEKARDIYIKYKDQNQGNNVGKDIFLKDILAVETSKILPKHKEDLEDIKKLLFYAP